MGAQATNIAAISEGPSVTRLRPDCPHTTPDSNYCLETSDAMGSLRSGSALVHRQRYGHALCILAVGRNR